MQSDMRFNGVWRDHQARLLAEIDTHLDDGRLHIVAAPGSGKTVLGLEVMRRIGRATLILAPSLAIRLQWRERLFPLFLQDPYAWEDHISTEIENPAALTIATYQALHAVHASGPERFDALIAALKAIGPITLIVDEAHHLRREWWTALFALRDRLADPVLVALTATPPYDAPFAEWARYEALCGPIDSEIPVPELVRNGDLCPHQDHVHLSLPGHDEYALLIARRQGIQRLTADLIADSALVESLSLHPWLTHPHDHEAALLARPEYLTALMILLRAAGHAIPPRALALLGAGRATLPALSPFWLETLFQGLIDEPESRRLLGDTRWSELRRVLTHLGLIENKRVAICESKAIFTAIAGSVAKLESIVTIARAEAEALGDDLRLLILSDRVRADELPRNAETTFAPTKLGVVPIFETLRRASVMPDALAVLTGTLVILPISAAEAVDDEAAAMRIDPARLHRRSMPGCPTHVSLEADGDTRHRVPALVTRLFASGKIRILVGTQALLGEGWDAPAINSLILASNAGSHMLSNQMRGRAIRVDPARPEKVAAIWHLATVAPDITGEAPADQSGDMVLLARRFEAFEGIANGDSIAIENGIDRLGLDLSAGIEAANSRTMMLAGDRAGVARKWQRSLGGAQPRSHVRQMAEPTYAPSSLAWRDTLRALAISGASGGAMSALGALRHFIGAGGPAMVAMLFCGATFLYSLPSLSSAAILWRRNGTIEGSIAQVGAALVSGLCHAGALSNDADRYAVLVRPGMDGRQEVTIDGATRAEERAFLNALAELLGPIQNPRYLLVRESWLWRRRRTDYHAVPASIGSNKEHAEHFLREWGSRIGSSRLVFTRNGAGRRILLRARVQSLSAGLQSPVKRRSVWM